MSCMRTIKKKLLGVNASSAFRRHRHNIKLNKLKLQTITPHQKRKRLLVSEVLLPLNIATKKERIPEKASNSVWTIKGMLEMILKVKNYIGRRKWQRYKYQKS